MPMHFANLKPHELEMMALVSEECGEACAEVCKIVGKAIRHGLDESHPDGGPNNVDLVARELGQVAAVTEMMIQLGIIDRVEVEAGTEEKWRKLGDYLHHVDVDADARTVERTDRRVRREARRDQAITKRSTKRKNRKRR